MFQWRDNPQTIARLVDRNTMGGFFKQKTILPPNEACLKIKNGKVVDFFTQEKVKRMGGGLSSHFKSDDSAIQYVFMDMSPIDLSFPIKAKSAEHMEVKGVGTMTLNINTDDTSKLLNFFTPDVEMITRFDIIKALTKELNAKVLQPQIGKVSNEEFHGNQAIRFNLEKAARIMMNQTLSEKGLTLKDLFVTWGQSAYDELKTFEQENELQSKKKDVESQVARDELRRRHETFLQRINQEAARKVAETQGDEAAETAKMAAQVEREALAADEKLRQQKAAADAQLEVQQRAMDMQMDAKKKEAELDMMELNSALEMKKKMQEQKLARQQAQAELEAARKQQETELEIRKFQEKELAQQREEQTFKTQQMAMQTGATERVLKMAQETGSLDPDTVKEMMKQQTLQKAMDRSEGTATAFAQAEGQRSSMDAFKQGMSASQAPPAPVGPTCPHCSGSVQAEWKACPSCGNKLKLACECGFELKPEWKACPGCGNAL